MLTEDYFKNFKASNSAIEHAYCVKNISEEIFFGLREVTGKNPLLYFENDVKLLSISALLHDVGTFFEGTKIKTPHNKLGAKLILENKIDGIKENEIKIIAAAIRYHRGALPEEKHGLYSSLNEEDKKKTLVIASILRLADALDRAHSSVVQKVTLSKEEGGKFLTLDAGVNIMFNVGIKNAFEKKKNLFEKVFGIKIGLKDG